MINPTRRSEEVKTREGQNQNSSKSVGDQFTDNLAAQDLASDSGWGSASRVIASRVLPELTLTHLLVS